MNVIDSEDYFDSGEVLDGGSSGVYGEIGWFMPQYLVESQSNSIVPRNLKNNNTLRNMMIEAVVNGTNKNWIDEFHKVRSNLSSDYPFALPTYDKPTIFGSVDSYAMSSFAHNQSLHMFDQNEGMDWNYATFGSESTLSQFMIEMYKNELPFITNIYRCVISARGLLFCCTTVDLINLCFVPSLCNLFDKFLRFVLFVVFAVFK